MKKKQLIKKVIKFLLFFFHISFEMSKEIKKIIKFLKVLCLDYTFSKNDLLSIKMQYF